MAKHLKIDPEHVNKLAHSKTYEEFLVNKDMLNIHGKLGQKFSFLVLEEMAKHHADAKLACKLVNEAKHISIGMTLRDKLWIAHYTEHRSRQTKDNLKKILDVVQEFFCLY